MSPVASLLRISFFWARFLNYFTLYDDLVNSLFTALLSSFDGYPVECSRFVVQLDGLLDALLSTCFNRQDAWRGTVAMVRQRCASFSARQPYLFGVDTEYYVEPNGERR